MNTSMGKFAALALVAVPFVAHAQNIAGQVGTVNRGAERVTLLPGPTLLSPAPGAPQSTPNITIVPAAQLRHLNQPQWRFVPAVRATEARTPSGSLLQGPGTLTLESYNPHETVTPASKDAPARKDPPPNPNLFRFEEKLVPPAIPLTPATPR